MSKSTLLQDGVLPEREFLAEAAQLAADGRIGLPRAFLNQKGWLQLGSAPPELVGEIREAGWIRLWRLDESLRLRLAALHEAAKRKMVEGAPQSEQELAVFEDRYRSVPLYVENECRVRLPAAFVQVLRYGNSTHNEILVRVHARYIDIVSAWLRMSQLTQYLPLL